MARTTTLKSTIILSAVLASLAVVPALAQPPGPERIEVTTTDDELNTDGDCSLREAIQAINTGSTVDTCDPSLGSEVYVPAGTYLLDSTLILTKDIFIIGDLPNDDLLDRGQDPGVTVIDGQHQTGLFEVYADASFDSLRLQNGNRLEGGAILNYYDPEGGGGASDGDNIIVGPDGIDLYNVEIIDNTAANGGGIASYGPMILFQCLFDGNTASSTVVPFEEIRGDGPEPFDVRGGALAMYGNLTAFGTTFSNNTAEMVETFDLGTASGGAVYLSNEGFSFFVGTGFYGNTALSSSFLANTFALGGALYADGEMSHVFFHSVFSNNDAVGQNQSLGLGGGIFAETTPILRGEMAPASVGLFSTTIFQNSATDSGGGVLGNVEIGSTILVGNTAPAEPNCGDGSQITTNGYNLLESTDIDCPGDENDQTVTAPSFYLDDLADNGGFVLTHRLQDDSPAINNGTTTLLIRDPEADCNETDARGFDRSDGGPCDIGAYEITENIAIEKTSDPAFVPGESANYTITVSNPGYFTASVDVDDLFPAVLTECSFTCGQENRGGPVSTCAGSGDGDIDDTASILGSQSVTYQATCSVPSSLLGSVVNSASATALDVLDPVLDNNTSEVETPLTPMADVSLTLVDPPVGVPSGEALVLNMKIRNDGPSDALDKDFGDLYVTTGTIIDVDCEGGDSIFDVRRPNTRTGLVLCTYDSIPAGTEYDITVRIYVNVPQYSDISYGFYTRGGTPDPDFANNETSGTTGVDILWRGGFESGDTSAWSLLVPAPAN